MTQSPDSSQASASTAVETGGRLIIVLMADVRGYTSFTQAAGDEEAARLAARFAAVMRQGVEAHGGRLLELEGDGAMAVFESARRALWASVELQERFARELEIDPSLPLRVGIGLDAGELVPLEGGYRGGALNLAARLCSRAQAGEILSSELVVQLARRVKGLDYAEQGPVRLKGFDQAVQVIRVLPSSEEGSSSPRGYVPGDDDASRAGVDLLEDAAQRLPTGGFLGALPAGPLVDRRQEMETVLLPLMEAVADGSGRLVMLTGEAGVGKTRLAQELTLAVRDRGFVVAAGRCYEPQQAVAFYPFLEVLSSAYLAASPPIQAQVPLHWPYLAHLLPDLLTIEQAPGGVVESPEDQQRLFRAVTGFIQALAAVRPVALLLDDLHWADSASLDLLQDLARQTRAYPVLLLGTYREADVDPAHPLSRAVRDLNREQLMLRLPVHELTPEGTKALVAAEIGETQVTDELARFIHRHAEGNPFFIQEILRGLKERGELGSDWAQGDLHAMAVPESVRSAIAERVMRLSPPSQDALHEASVLGQTFTFDQLVALTGHDEEQVEEAIDEATAAGLVRPLTRETYAFNHALTQQALYSDLLPRKRSRRHLAAGEVLERLPESERRKRAAELAWHFLEGEDSARALHYLLLAGDQAEALFAHEDAERQYRLALALARDDDDAPHEAEAHHKLGTLLSTVARYDDALDELERAAEIYRRLGDPEAEGVVTAHIGVAHVHRLTPEEGIARIHQVLEGLGDRDPSAATASLYSSLAALYFLSGRYQEQLAAAERAAEVARSIGDDRLLLQAEYRRSLALSKLGQGEAARQALEGLVPLADAAGDLYIKASALAGLGWYYESRADLEAFRAHAERALEAASQLGDAGLTSFMLYRLGSHAALAGEWGRCRELGEQALSLSHGLGDSFYSGYPLRLLGTLSALQGDLNDASRALHEALTVSERHSDLQNVRHIARWLALLDLEGGAPERARERLEPLLDRPGLREEDVTWLLPVLGRAYLEEGNLVQAEGVLASALERAGAEENQLMLAEALRVQGTLLMVLSREPEAEYALSQAVSMCRVAGIPYDLGLALYERGVAQARGGDEPAARSSLKEALSLFRSLGAHAQAARAEAALAALDSTPPPS